MKLTLLLPGYFTQVANHLYTNMATHIVMLTPDSCTRPFGQGVFRPTVVRFQSQGDPPIKLGLINLELASAPMRGSKKGHHWLSQESTLWSQGSPQLGTTINRNIATKTTTLVQVPRVKYILGTLGDILVHVASTKTATPVQVC